LEPTSDSLLKILWRITVSAEKKIDPFGGAKSRLLRRDKEAPLRVNSEQAHASGWESKG